MTADHLPNKLGVHALVWTASWDEDYLNRAFEHSRRIGYELIELPRFDPSMISADKLRKLLDAHDLKCAITMGLAWDADISNPDAEIARRGEEMLDTAVSAARDIDVELLGGILYSALGKYPKAPTREGRQNAVDALRRIADKAQAVEVPMVLEIVNRYETNLLNSTDQGLQFLADIGHDWPKLHLDTYHMNIEECDIGDALRRAGDKLGYFHIGENNRGPLGSGSIDFASAFTALRDIDYKGWITFESFSSEVLDEGLSNDIAIWRNMWTDNVALSDHAYRTMVSHIEASMVRSGQSTP
ncbi:sugar phosphate isomerase/epimerase family protein [Ahrensia marina]|uniref:TIM barrel protein n=1 Tax=Ahrensia marina TaxID=1514904 RepID=UPI0035D0B8E1